MGEGSRIVLLTREALSEEGTFVQRLERTEGAGHVGIWGGAFLAEGMEGQKPGKSGGNHSWLV